MQLTAHPEAGFSLIIERGQTRFPERPVDSDRFLIGAGSNCQLQLGGEIPILHSIIVPEKNHLWIDAVVPSPPLLVNGRLVRESELHPGDIIEISGFVFCVSRQLQPLAPALSIEPHADPAALSAEQLVDLLSEEISTLESLETGRRQGADALLQAARRVGRAAQADLATLQDSPEVQIRSVLSQLKARAEELDAREAALNAHALQLEATQQKLQQQLEELLAARTPVEEAPLRMTA